MIDDSNTFDINQSVCPQTNNIQTKRTLILQICLRHTGKSNWFIYLSSVCGCQSTNIDTVIDI